MQENTQAKLSVLERLKRRVPGGYAAKECHPTRHQPDTLDIARKKVIDKLRANKAFVENGFKALQGKDAPDKTYKPQGAGYYGVGAKSGNRWLKGIVDGDNFFTDVPEAELAGTIGEFIAMAEAGEFDDAIDEVRKASLGRRNGSRP